MSPTDHDRIVDAIIGFNPHVVVHIAVWEPFSRATPDRARQLTDDAVTSILGAAPKGIAQVQHVIVIDMENWSFNGPFGLFPSANGIAHAGDTIRQVRQETRDSLR